MEFGYTPEQQALRHEVRTFIAQNLTPDVRAEMADLNEGFGVSPGHVNATHVNALFKKIGARGWLGISYPKEYGGQAGDRMTQYIVEEEFAWADISLGLGAAAGHLSTH